MKKKTEFENKNKPLIETMINTCALSITAFGTNCLVQRDVWGFGLILFGAGLEYFKYWGRKKKLW